MIPVEAVEAVLVEQGGLWFHAKPLRDTSLLHRWKHERSCSHEWHPENAMGVDWFCCKCGKEADGATK